jgi:hypothetical protein
LKIHVRTHIEAARIVTTERLLYVALLTGGCLIAGGMVWSLIQTLRNPKLSTIAKIGQIALLLIFVILVLSPPQRIGLNVNVPPVREAVLVAGSIHMPTHLYEGTTATVDLSLLAGHELNVNEARKLLGPATPDHLSLVLPVSGPNDQLAAELQAPGSTVGGDTKQLQPMSGAPMRYQWSCFFEKAGDYRVTLRFNIVTPSGPLKEFHSRSFDVAVRDFFWLPRPVVFALGGVVAFISALGSLVTLLGWYQKHRDTQRTPSGRQFE